MSAADMCLETRIWKSLYGTVSQLSSILDLGPFLFFLFLFGYFHLFLSEKVEVLYAPHALDPSLLNRCIEDCRLN